MYQSQEAGIKSIFRIFFLALPFVYLPLLVDPALLPRQIFLNVFLLALIFFIVTRVKEFTVDKFVFSQQLFIVLIGWLAANLVSGILCVNSAEWMGGLSKYFLFILFFFLLSLLLLSDKIDSNELTKSIILFSAATTGIGLLQIFIPALQSSGMLSSHENLTSSPIANKSLLPSCLFLTLPFLLSTDKLNLSWRKFSRILLFVELILIIVIQTKAVWAAGLIFLIVIIYYRKKLYPVKKTKHSRKISVPGILIAMSVFTVAVIYVLNYVDTRFAQRIFGTANNFHSASTRISLWQNSFDMIRDHFLFGVGTNNWQIWFPHEGMSKFNETVASGVVTFRNPHSDFLWVFSETGVFGFIFYLLMFLVSIRYCFRLIRNSTDEPDIRRYVFFVAAIMGYGVISLIHFPMERVEHHVIFFTILSIVTTDYLRKFNYTIKRHTIRKTLMKVLAGLSLLTLLVSILRINGEYHSQLLMQSYEDRNWNETIHQKNKAGNIFYNMNIFSVPLAWYSGTAYYNQQDFSHATEEFESAHRIHPFNIQVLNSLADSYEKNNRHKEAIEFYSKALEIFPGNREGQLNLSRACLNHGDVERAFEVIEHVGIDTTDVKQMDLVKEILEKKGITFDEFRFRKKGGAK